MLYCVESELDQPEVEQPEVCAKLLRGSRYLKRKTKRQKDHKTEHWGCGCERCQDGKRHASTKRMTSIQAGLDEYYEEQYWGGEMDFWDEYDFYQSQENHRDWGMSEDWYDDPEDWRGEPEDDYHWQHDDDDGFGDGFGMHDVRVSTDLMQRMMQYIENTEVAMDAEFGGHRILSELISDGWMPSLYNDLKRANR